MKLRGINTSSFKSKRKAEIYRRKINTKYGYKPRMFTLINKRKRNYLIVKPKGLRRIR